MKKAVVGLLLLYVLLPGCRREPSKLVTSSENKVIINTTHYNSPNTLKVVINQATLNQNELVISISGSGCSEKALDNDLVAEDNILESMPPQRNIKLVLRMEGQGSCAAYFTKTFRYDISALKVEGYNQLLLNLDGYEGSLVYAY